MKKTIDARTILDFQRTVGNQFVNRLLRGRQIAPVMPLPQEEETEAPVPPVHAGWPWRVPLISGIFILFRIKRRTTVTKPDGTTAN